MTKQKEIKIRGYNTFNFIKEIGPEIIECETGIEVKNKPDHIDNGYGNGYMILIYSKKSNPNIKYTIFASNDHEPDDIGHYTLVKVFETK